MANRPQALERTLSRVSSPCYADRPPSLQWQQSVARSLSPAPTDPPKKPPPPSTLARLKSAAGHVGLMGLLAAYTCLGGVAFVKLESPNEVSQHLAVRSEAGRSRSEAVEALMKAFRENPPCGETEHVWEGRVRARVEEVLGNYSDKVYDMVDGGYDFRNMTFDADNCGVECKWGFRNATFFSATLITTIGYGNMAPVTSSGRAFCIVYSLVGIPLTLIVIADVGKLLAKFVKFSYRAFKDRLALTRKRNLEEEDASQNKASTSLKVGGALLLLLLYIALGAACFLIWETEWTFFDSFYFSFITMTTIGLGDIVPEDQAFMMLCMVYILAGLAMTSTVLEIVRSEYEKSWQRMMEASKRLQLQNLTDALKKIGEQMEEMGDASDQDFDLLRQLTHAFGAEAAPRRPPPIVYYESTL